MAEPQSKPVTATQGQRIRIGILLILSSCGLALLGGWYWVFLVVLLFYFGFKELNLLMRAKGIRPSHLIVYTAGSLLILAAATNKTQYFAPIITAATIASFFRLLFRRPVGSISDIGATHLGFFYIAYLPAHYILLRETESAHITNPLAQPGLGFLLFTLLVISASDVLAYYCGKRFGKNLLYPEISPKKTREGAIGGMIGGIIIGLIVGSLIHLYWVHAFILSSLLVIVGQLGDLSESLMKRDAGLKDSGALLQGHGGILDRTDSYLFSGAVSYYYIHWIVYQRGLAEDFLHLVSPYLAF